MASGVSFCGAGTIVFNMEPTADAAKLRLIAELAGVISLAAQSRLEARTRQMLAKIKAEWRSVPEEYRPWGYWVREYAPLPADADTVDFQSVPKQVWFFDKSGVRKEDVWSWMRFVAARTLAPSVSPTRLFPIGLTAFAPYQGSDECYVEVLWGGLWGMAWHISSGSESQMLNKELWRA